MIDICILLSTYNGAPFLHEQLDSISHQDFSGSVAIVIRDDGSSDNTIEIVEKYNGPHDLILHKGENLGPANSFYDLLRIAPVANFYAFCDQDDVWMPHKISSGIIALKNMEAEKPCLYFSNATYVDQELKSMATFHTVVPNYFVAGTMVCNPALGCTIMFNHALLSKVKEVRPQHSSMHDKFLIMTALLLGKVTYDHESMILYRQHQGNVIGKKGNIVKKLRQSYKLWFKSSNTSLDKEAQELLAFWGDGIAPKDKAILILFATYKKNLFSKTKLLLQRETRTTNAKANRSFIIRILLNLA